MKPSAITFIPASCDAGANKKGSAQGPMTLKAHLKANPLDQGIVSKWDADIKEHRGNPKDTVKATVEKIQKAVHLSFHKNELPVLIGGDHSVAMGSISAVSEHCAKTQKELFVLWVDAHADIHTVKSSETGNIHGMPVAMLAGIDTSGLIIKPKKHIDLRNFLLIGARSIDEGERSTLAKYNISWFDDDFAQFKEALAQWLIDLPENAHLHLSFDLDAIDPTIAPGVSTAEKGGLSWINVLTILILIKSCGKLGSLDLVEFNPFFDKEGETAELASEMLNCLLAA